MCGRRPSYETGRGPSKRNRPSRLATTVALVARVYSPRVFVCQRWMRAPRNGEAVDREHRAGEHVPGADLRPLRRLAAAERAGAVVERWRAASGGRRREHQQRERRRRAPQPGLEPEPPCPHRRSSRQPPSNPAWRPNLPRRLVALAPGVRLATPGSGSPRARGGSGRAPPRSESPRRRSARSGLRRGASPWRARGSRPRAARGEATALHTRAAAG